jgi:hypothetical protein
MTLPTLPTHPLLQAHFAINMTNQGQLICNEEVAHQHRTQYELSECCRQETYVMDGTVRCGYCGEHTSTY